MAYKSNNIVAIDDNRAGSFANVTVQNNGFLEVNSSDGFQGTVAGYTSGWRTTPSTNVIDKFPFAADTNATDVGDLTVSRYVVSGQSSTTHGYSSGGFPGPTNVNTIDKFPFAVDTNASDIGNLTTTRGSTSGQSSTVSGYVSGGNNPPITNTIDKFPFAVDTNASDIGDLTQGRQLLVGQSSTTHGYTSGGSPAAPWTLGTTNIIDKFPFATDTNATDVGDITQSRAWLAGQSSTASGYASGGNIPPANPIIQVNTIEKFPFATDTNATDIGDLSQTRASVTGQSSTSDGYTSGGDAPPTTNVIDKFPFSSDTNATDVGDLTVARQDLSGQQD